MRRLPTVELLRSRLSRLDNTLDGLRVERDIARQKLAEELCPFKPGDIIRPAKGNSLHGRGEKFLVVGIKWYPWSDGYRMRMRPLRTDGSIIKRSFGSCTGYDYKLAGRR